MKRFLFFLTLLFGICCCAGVVYADTPQEGVLPLLSQLDIMKGDPDGNLRLADPVSRAEFTKAAVASSSYRNSVASHLSISPFPDVTYRHWAAPYVRVGVTNGLISGYPDATFRPDDNVLYEEGITMMLRVLGYSDQDFGVSWPYGQLGLADNLDLTDNIDCSAGEIMNRGQVAQLLYNALCTKQKNQSITLATGFDVQIQDDVTLIADCSDDASIASDEIFTSNGTYKLDTPLDRSLLGRQGSVAVKNGTKLIAFLPDSGDPAGEEYVIYSTLSDMVMAYHKNSLSPLKVDDQITVYKGTTRTTYGALKNSLEMGDILRVKKKNGTDIDYMTWQKGKVAGPITVRSSDWGSTLNITDSTTVMRNGQASSYHSLQSYDIAYYLSDIDLVLAYSDKVTGVYEKASPNKDMPNAVTISGKEYIIEGSAAFTKLASGGTFLLGDTITALLGKNGQIADVISPTLHGSTMVGYLLESGRKTFQSGNVETYTGYYVKLVLSDGEAMEYTTDKDYSTHLNKVVKVSIQGCNAKVSVLNNAASADLNGTFDWEQRTLGKMKLADDVKILDIGTTDLNEASVYAALYPQRLDGVTLSGSQILYYDLDSHGEISQMILKNVTNDGYSFGLMIAAKQESSTHALSGSYEYLVNGQIYTVRTSGRLFNVSAGSGLRLSGNPANPDSVSKLSEVTQKISELRADCLITSTESYPISGNVSVYRKSSLYATDYIQIPLSDLLAQEHLSITAYYDKVPSAGGQIRVIVAY